MKIVAVFMLLAVATHAANVDYFKDDLVSTFMTRAIGDKIKAFLEKAKEIMKTGDEAKGIPKLDPLSWVYQEINIDDELLTIHGKVNDVLAQGLSNFTVDHVDFKIGKKNFSIALTWPVFKGRTSFNITAAKIMDFIPIFGMGNATFEVENLKFATNALIKLDYKNKKAELKSFVNTKISLGKLKLDAKGLYDNDEFSEIISKIISDITPQAIDDFQKEIVTRVDNIALKVGNEVLTHLDFEAIWKGNN